MLPVPLGDIFLRSANGSFQTIFGYFRFVLIFGDKALPVKSLLIPHLGPGVMLINNNLI